MHWIIIPTLFLILIFLPIRVKVTVIYENSHLIICIYGKEIKIGKKTIEETSTSDRICRIKKLARKLIPKNIKTAIYNLNNRKFKPSIKLNCEGNYGFDDAALTGMSYGLIQNISYTIYSFTQVLFKIKNYKFNIEPHFNDPLLNFRIRSIISVSLAQIIYMVKTIYFK